MGSRKQNHRIITAVLVAFFLVSSASGDTGNASGLPAPQGHVNDFAAVLDDATRARLETVLENLKHRTGIDFLIATVKTSGEKDLYDYSVTVANEWNTSSARTGEKTLLILIATDTGKFFTQASVSAQKGLPTGLVGYMGRHMRAHFLDAKYREGLLAGIEAFVDILGQQTNMTFASLDQQPARPVSIVQTTVRSESAKGQAANASAEISSAKRNQLTAAVVDNQLLSQPVKVPSRASTPADKTALTPVDRIRSMPNSPQPASTLIAPNLAELPSLSSTPPQLSVSNSVPPLVVKTVVGVGTLRGQVFDALGGLVVGATVTAIDAAGVEKTATSDSEGKYVLSDLASGKCVVRASAPGFAVYENNEVGIATAARRTLNIKLEVTIGKQEVTVAAESSLGSSMNMRVLRGKDLAALPSGPGGLSAALRALAVPATGPNGPTILVNGFSGGRLPPKESIREIRISENPFSSEYPQLGFGRIEILTKPGSDKFQGSAFFNFNDESLNSRNPFAPTRAPYQSKMFGGSLSGPIKTKRSSFFVDFERQEVNNNALINATILDPLLNIVRFSESIVTPQRRTSFSPRFEFQLNKDNTLVARYSFSRGNSENAGVGDFSLASRAYNTANTEQLLQLTETAVLGSNVINELRFQYLRNRRRENGNNSIPTILVPEAFIGGGAQSGSSFNNEDRWELQNYTSWALAKHNIKAGAQLRGVRLTDFATRDFGGTFTFSGGLAPELDSANEVVRDAAGPPVITPITSIERYRRTQLIPLFLQSGLSLTDIRALGAGPTQFSISGGNPQAAVRQYDLGLFAQDDWQLHPNLTLGLGLRYELQNNISDRSNFAPRVAIAWSPDGNANQRKTVIRAGMGVFYDRFSESYALAARRFNGQNEQRFIVTDPALLDLYPLVPSITQLSAFAVPQAITRVASDLRAPYTIQSSIGLERELPSGLTLATTFINTRTLRMLRSRNINAPLPGTGIRPFANSGDIFQYESSGYFKQTQLAVNAVERFKDVMTLWATYILNSAQSDTDGADTFPANTYDLTNEYGRSALDVRHSFYLGGWITGPWKLSFSPLVFFRSGAPFNITTGRDSNGDTLFTERPAFANDLSRPSVVVTRFGAFDLNPVAADRIIPRNYGQGPGYFSVNLGVSRAFGFGPERGQKAPSAKGPAGAERSFGRFFSRRYSLTFTIQVENLFNHPNPGLPVGNLSSPFFGQSYSSAGAYGFGSNPAGNRRIEIQIYLSF